MDIDHGHYIAICRINGEWWAFDDREACSTGNVMGGETMLFETTAMLSTVQSFKSISGKLSKVEKEVQLPEFYYLPVTETNRWQTGGNRSRARTSITATTMNCASLRMDQGTIYGSLMFGGLSLSLNPTREHLANGLL
jgi:hypothetical protein